MGEEVSFSIEMQNDLRPKFARNHRQTKNTMSSALDDMNITPKGKSKVLHLTVVSSILVIDRLE